MTLRSPRKFLRRASSSALCAFTQKPSGRPRAHGRTYACVCARARSPRRRAALINVLHAHARPARTKYGREGQERE